MTIEFNCPNCNSVIAFADQHAGKRAKCTTCGQGFVIPQKNYEKASKVKPPKEEKGDPIPGFYQAVLVDNWKVFTNIKNITGFAFIITAVVFKYFTSNLNFVMTMPSKSRPFDIYVPLGYVCRGISWGFLFWYYREIIYFIGFDQDEFPEVALEGFYSFVWKIFSSVYTLFSIFLVTCLPALVIYLVFENIFSEMPILFYSLITIGTFLVPAAIINMAVGKDLTLLRPDYLIIEAFGALGPYILIFVLFLIAIILQANVKQYQAGTTSGIGTFLLLNLAVQMVFVYAMRAIGLFYRHYSCHMPW